MELTPRLTRNALVARAAAAGSMVLLKNTNGALPILREDGAPLPAAVFGIGQIFTALCQKAMTPWRACSILSGLEASERIKPDGLLAHKYRTWAMEHPDAAEMPLDQISFEELAAHDEAALVVITRAPGDDRLTLTAQEREMIAAAAAAFARSVLILNTQGYLELGESARLCAAVLYMGVAGQEGGNALADVLTARSLPCGRLAQSWPEKLSSFDEAAETADRFSGYRYFDSFGTELLYPFGFGLSYGKAELGAVSAGLDGTDVYVTAEVQNTGETWPVQETVQVYVSHPEDKLEQPAYSLNCFAKTKLLEPGESQTVTLRFPVTELSVFREDASAFCLEEGYYDIRVGTSSRNTCVAGSLRLTRSAVILPVEPLKLGPSLCRSRSGAEAYTYPGEKEELEQAHQHAIRLSDRNLPRGKRKKGREFSGCRGDEKVHTLQELQKGWCSVFQLVASLDDESLRRLVCDFGYDPSSVPGALGASAALERCGIPAVTIAAGSDGLQLTRDIKDENDKIVRRQLCTAFPAPGLLACSFDPALAESVGAAIGRDMKEYGVSLWLAPGVNLLRTPRQEGAWECWSEDPVVAGRCAAAIAAGVGKNGAAVLRAADTRHEVSVSLPAWRDLYALGFEIAAGSYRAALLPAMSVSGEPMGENSPLVRSMIVDCKYSGMFLADGERYAGGPTRVELEKSALRIVKLLAELTAENDMQKPREKQ
jgi:hypothetical protein